MKYSVPTKLILLGLLLRMIFPAVNIAKVGDWKSYGSVISWYDLAILNGVIWARTSGGLVSYANGEFEQITNSSGLIDHNRVSAFFIDEDGRKWTGTSISPAIISYIDTEGAYKEFDLGLTEIQVLYGKGSNIFAAYKQNLTTGIAHFVQADDEYVFRDFYDQFPEEIDKVFTMEIMDDKLLLGTSVGLWQADLSSPNLKPASSWSRLEGEGMTGNVKSIYSVGEILYFTRDNLLISYDGVNFTEERNTLSVSSQPFFLIKGESLYFIQGNSLYLKNPDTGSWIYTFTVPGLTTGVAATTESICLGIKNNGFITVSADWQIVDSFRPNSLFSDTYQNVTVADGAVYLSNSQGISIFKNESWHNIIRSNTVTSLHSAESVTFTADTLAYAVIGAPQTYDILVTSRNMLYVSINGVHTNLGLINYTPLVKPGPIFYVNLENHSEYGMLDTTDDLFDGSEASTGGTEEYVVARGMVEGPDGSMWFINAHASNGEPLIRISVNNNITKYSVDESGSKLQVLAREMVFDDRNRLWIANQSHQENQPVTTGGLTVYDPYKNEWYLITTVDGLANNDVYSIDKDIDGSMWIVSAGGVQNISVPVSWTEATFHSLMAQNIRPVINGLGDVSVSKIRADIQGNKWILTSDGGVRVYQRNGTFYNSGYGYTMANSPLLSDIVFDIDFDDERGIAYILTSNGLNALETPWTSEVNTTDNLIIYPQPYNPQTDPWLIIDGIPDQSEMIISTLNGRNLMKIDSEYSGHMGKQIQWDGRLRSGDKIRPGVYYIFIYNIDGLASTKKFAVQ